MRRALAAAIMIAATLSGCVGERIPPTAASLDSALTAQFVSDNAPPQGFGQITQFAQVDANLDKLTNWHYTVSLAINGIYAGTSDKATGTIAAEIFSNELSGERRVILRVSGAAFGLKPDVKERYVEGVRIGNAFYVVDQNKVCTKATDPASQKVAVLTASSLIGGIKQGQSTYAHKLIGSLPAWQYTFLPQDLNPPPVQLGENGTIAVASGDLWIAPSRNAVADYSLTLNVQNVIVQGSRPVTGSVLATYHLLETNVGYNISIPYGC